jgi:hypothetical protein
MKVVPVVASYRQFVGSMFAAPCGWGGYNQIGPSGVHIYRCCIRPYISKFVGLFFFPKKNVIFTIIQSTVDQLCFLYLAGQAK